MTRRAACAVVADLRHRRRAGVHGRRRGRHAPIGRADRTRGRDRRQRRRGAVRRPQRRGRQRLGLPVPHERQPRPGRRPGLCRLRLPAHERRLPHDVPASQRAEPRDLTRHHRHLRGGVDRPVDRGRVARPRRCGHRGGHPRRPQEPVRRRLLRPQQRHVRRGRGGVRRQRRRAGAGDPQLRRRQQRPPHAAHGTSCTASAPTW
jgi:hypothetical protein